MNEAALHRAVADYLRAVLPVGARVQHIPTYASSKQVGGIWKSRGASPGWCDFYVWYGDGPPIGIELKSATGRLSPVQAALHEWAQDNDQPWYVCRSVEEVESRLREHGVPLKGRAT